MDPGIHISITSIYIQTNYSIQMIFENILTLRRSYHWLWQFWHENEENSFRKVNTNIQVLPLAASTDE